MQSKKRKAATYSNSPGSGRSNSKRKSRPDKRLDPSNVYVAFGRQAEEDKNPRKFDWAPKDGDHFKLDSDVEDEEIDEETAFNEEDNEKFGDWFPMNGDEGDGDEIFDEDEDEIDVLLERAEDVGQSDEEEETDVDADHDQHRSLIQSVAGLEPMEVQRKVDSVATEAVPESISNIGSTGAGKDGDLTIEGLMATLESNRENEGATQWALERLTEATPVSVPMPRMIRERQERKAGYQNAKDDAKKWKDIIKANREAPTLHFAPPTLDLKSNKLVDMVADFEPQDGLEEELSTLLRKAGADAPEGIEKSEDVLAMKALSVQQLKERRARLRGMRSMLFFHEIKAKRVAAIKSKEYHRKLQRSMRRKSVKFSDLPDDEAARKVAEEMEYKRAEERMTQRHSTKTRWAKRVLRRGLNIQDEETREAINEQLRQGQELKKKIEKMDAKDGSESDTDVSAIEDGQDEGEAGGSFKRTHKAALDLLEGNSLDEDVPKKGLFALPFIRKSMERRKEQARSKAEQVLAEIDETPPEKIDRQDQKGRFQFSGKRKNSKQQHIASSDDEAELDPIANEVYEPQPQQISPVDNMEGVEDGHPLDQSAVQKALASHDDPKEHSILPSHVDRTGGVASRGYLFRKSPADGDTISSIPVNGMANGNLVKKPSQAPMATREDIQSASEDEELVEISDKEIEASDALEVNNEASKDDVLISPKVPISKSQAELIEMAFAGDDVDAEFHAEKEREIQKDLGPELEINVLPGWGTWKSQQNEPGWMKEARQEDKKKREAAKASRRDATMKHVIINERKPKSLAMYTLGSLPQPFKSIRAYEAHMKHPIGKDFNPLSSVADFTRPSVVKNAGVVIDPLEYSEPLHDTVNDTLSHYRPTDIKVSRIVGGTVDKYEKLGSAEPVKKKKARRTQRARRKSKPESSQKSKKTV